MKRCKRLIEFGAAVVILFIKIGLYYLLWAHYHSHVITMPFWRRDNWFVTGLYGIMLFVFYNLYGGLKIGLFRKNSIIYSQPLAILVANVSGYLLLALMERHWYVPLPFVILTTVDMALVSFWTGIFQWTYNLLFPPRQLLLIYGKHLVTHVLEKMNLRDDKYVLTAIIRIDEGIERTMQKVPKCGGVVIGDLGNHDRSLILKCYYEIDKHVYMIPKISDVLTRNSDESELFDTMFLFSRNNDLQVDQFFCKRVLDILSVGVPLILGLPLFLPFIITIRLEDRGPIFYKQYRLTKDGRTFDILKLRTTRVNAEADGMMCLAAQADDRITQASKVFRTTRLDKPPQVLSTLKGDINMVGSRPGCPEIAAEYKKEIPGFDYRLKVKADPTGYAQIYGVYDTTPYDKLKFNLIYVRNYSIFLDLKLIFVTPKILFMKEKTKGTADGQATAVQQMGDLSGELKF